MRKKLDELLEVSWRREERIYQQGILQGKYIQQKEDKEKYDESYEYYLWEIERLTAQVKELTFIIKSKEEQWKTKLISKTQ